MFKKIMKMWPFNKLAKKQEVQDAQKEPTINDYRQACDKVYEQIFEQKDADYKPRVVKMTQYGTTASCGTFSRSNIRFNEEIYPMVEHALLDEEGNFASAKCVIGNLRDNVTEEQNTETTKCEEK